VWQLSGAGIGKQSAGARYDYREERVLVSNALVQDKTIERSGYWQAMCWHKMRL
jgi:hypothetical protein